VNLAVSAAGMTRPTHAFKIGQQVYHHPGSGPRRTGPHVIIGMARQSSGVILLKIKSGATRTAGTRKRA
jgi:hypothetical protein